MIERTLLMILVSWAVFNVAQSEIFLFARRFLAARDQYFSIVIFPEGGREKLWHKSRRIFWNKAKYLWGCPTCFGFWIGTTLGAFDLAILGGQVSPVQCWVGIPLSGLVASAGCSIVESILKKVNPEDFGGPKDEDREEG